MPEILYRSKRVVLINKPVGMPSQSDPSCDPDAMSVTSEWLSSLGEDGRLWLVHRLDRTVGGVMAFARSAAVAAELSREIADGAFKKEYLAVAEGRVVSGEMRDWLFKDAAASKAFVVKSERRGAKLAALFCEVLEVVETAQGPLSLLRIELKTGRFHQIRAQLSHRGTPLVGDGKYGSRIKLVRTPSLFAYRLESPSVGRAVFACPDLGAYPWSQFPKECYPEEK